MAAPKFSIGIDLGTTNCAMAYVSLATQGAVSEIFAIPQWEEFNRLGESSTLASFLYLPTREEAAQLRGAQSPASGAAWIPGKLARKRAADTPGRVAHSAKSWLGHHAVDRHAAFLPWGSETVAATEKISPIQASALLLNYLRGAWETRMGACGIDQGFDDQQISITVPASFDAAAQRLTLEAAAAAGFPKNVRLLEEPQAAFYHWLETHQEPGALWRELSSSNASQHVLVIDVGGGTSDFSLFEISPQHDSALPAIRRVAVSPHILLGGDNIDLAIAHLVEPRMAGPGETLHRSQWQDLVARCRDLKELCLARNGEPTEEFTLSLPARGSNLFGAPLAAKVARAEITAILLDGFFPECAADARPAQTKAGLLEWGLPYAADSGVTRHLADFLRELPAVDAILFNGGSLHPEVLRQRIQQLVGNWQAGAIPHVLVNPEPDLAVARGAARFGSVLHHYAARIQSGAARSIYLEVHQRQERSLVCILPRGASAETEYRIENLPLELRLNQPVRFQCYYSTRHDDDHAGALVSHDPDRFHELPPVQTVARLAEGVSLPPDKRLPVYLTARLTEVGLLELGCISALAGVDQRWPLAFNLRAEGERGQLAQSGPAPGVAPEALAAASARIIGIFSKRLDPRDALTAARLLKSLEEILGAPKADWDIFLIRTLWTSLKRCLPCRRNSAAHEEAWLIVAGFLLRPGFGATTDDARIDDLWRIHGEGLAHPVKPVKLQEFILWRRVAGGLSRQRQQALLEPELPKLAESKNPPAELVRMAGSFERLDAATKASLIELFVNRARTLGETGGYAAPYLVALGQLLNRTPLYAGPETVVAPEQVAMAFASLEHLDWSKSPELAELFLRAARVTANRSLDLPRALRRQIASQLEVAGVAPLKIARIEGYVPIDRSERVSLFGESLPPGLILGDP